MRCRAAARSRCERREATVADGADRVLIEVSDTGVGMDEDTRRRCLEPFFTTKGERGTGLGLAMVYGMIQRHSAELEIDSEAGPGHDVAPDLSRLHGLRGRERRPISLRGRGRPAAAHSAGRRRSAAHQVAAGHAAGGRTSDHGDSRRPGRHRRLCRRRNSARELFDIVITDLGMPHVDGRKVAASIKSAVAGDPGHAADRLGPAAHRGERYRPPRRQGAEQAAAAAGTARGAGGAGRRERRACPIAHRRR